ncbi:hypothetical protein FSP39_004726 [Pinctada imbricata]|uniref:Methyltransferase-like protein 4 n=1 Tax=Pinctada imbricata TaxID=66713 RepID=A0AA88XQ28_PINIB|nr:hypothetical protein FSP39_004726 [Pinctada imbricata]
MAVILSSQNGFLIDHNMGLAQALKGTVSKEKDIEIVKDMMLKKELFLIEQPFMMDSQFSAMQDKTESKTVQGKGCEAKVTAYENLLEAAYEQKYFKQQEESEGNLPSEIISGSGGETSIAQKVVTNNFQAELDGSLIALADNNRTARDAAMKLQGTAEILSELCFSRREMSSSMPKVINKLNPDILHWKMDPFNKVISNLCGHPAVFNFNGDRYILPTGSTFFLSDFSNIEEMISYNELSSFDCIVMDPPWENKSVKRKKMYKTLTSQDFSKIPIPRLAAHNALIIVWVTNRMKHVDFIKECLFPAWNVQYLTDWFWIKVTTKGQMVYDINSDHKKPYELMVLGRYQSGHQDNSAEKSSLEVPENLVIVSVPSALHSMKPPLNDILMKFLPEKPRCLELFARNLWPGWTSWGNEFKKILTIISTTLTIEDQIENRQTPSKLEVGSGEGEE